MVVTGGSDGIGAEICEQMAKEGFNVCIVGRNSLKMDEAVVVKTDAKAKEPEKNKIDVVLEKLQKT